MLPLRDQLMSPTGARASGQQHQHRDPKSGDRQLGWQVHDRTLDGKTGEWGPPKSQAERWPIVLAMRNWEFYLAVVAAAPH